MPKIGLHSATFFPHSAGETQGDKGVCQEFRSWPATRSKSGNPHRGLDAIGEGHDTEGSQWIISVVDGLKRFIDRIRVYDIGDQDRIVDWIWRELPGLFSILGKAAKGHDKREAVYRGMYLGGDQSLTSREWMEKNIRQQHGPLGALYPTRIWTVPNPHSAIKEGGTPFWFYFLPNGLNAPDHPTWGGWSGRFVKTNDRIYRDATDTVDGVTDGRCTVWPWRAAFQNDFQARMDWCVQLRDKANHPPVAVCDGDSTRAVLTRNATAGGTVGFSAAASRDPDGDPLRYRWWIYPESGTYHGRPTLAGGIQPNLPSSWRPTRRATCTSFWKYPTPADRG